MNEPAKHLTRFEEDGYLLLRGLLQSLAFQGLLSKVEEAVDYIPGFLARSRSNPDGIDTWQTWHRRYKDSGITTK